MRQRSCTLDLQIDFEVGQINLIISKHDNEFLIKTYRAYTIDYSTFLEENVS